MARRKAVRAARTSRKRATGSVGALRRQAQTMLAQLRRVGMRQVRGLEREIAKLNGRRQALLKEIGLAGGTSARAAQRTRSGGTGRVGRVDWDALFARLPKTPFQASHVKALVPGINGGTLSQRLTRWVSEKKLKRTGTRRGTRYTRLG